MYPLTRSRASVTVVPIIGLHAIAQPLMREYPYCLARKRGSPSCIKARILRLGFFASPSASRFVLLDVHLGHLSALRNRSLIYTIS